MSTCVHRWRRHQKFLFYVSPWVGAPSAPTTVCGPDIAAHRVLRSKKKPPGLTQFRRGGLQITVCLVCISVRTFCPVFLCGLRQQHTPKKSACITTRFQVRKVHENLIDAQRERMLFAFFFCVGGRGSAHWIVNAERRCACVDISKPCSRFVSLRITPLPAGVMRSGSEPVCAACERRGVPHHRHDDAVPIKRQRHATRRTSTHTRYAPRLQRTCPRIADAGAAHACVNVSARFRRQARRRTAGAVQRWRRTR